MIKHLFILRDPDNPETPVEAFLRFGGDALTLTFRNPGDEEEEYGEVHVELAGGQLRAFLTDRESVGNGDPKDFTLAEFRADEDDG